jgi:hypothetical protein
MLHSAAQLLSPLFVVLSGSGGPVLISIGGMYKPFLSLCDAAYHDPQFSSSTPFRPFTYISLLIVQYFIRTSLTHVSADRSLATQLVILLELLQSKHASPNFLDPPRSFLHCISPGSYALRRSRQCQRFKVRPIHPIRPQFSCHLHLSRCENCLCPVRRRSRRLQLDKFPPSSPPLHSPAYKPRSTRTNMRNGN